MGERMSATARLLHFRRIGYGIGDIGFNLYFTTATLYLLYYYTDVFGLAAATAGWIFTSAMIWHAVADPVMGYLAGRTRSRWGQRYDRHHSAVQHGLCLCRDHRPSALEPHGRKTASR